VFKKHNDGIELVKHTLLFLGSQPSGAISSSWSETSPKVWKKLFTHS